MSRRPRLLKGNKGTEAPSNLIFFDTESRQHVRKGKTETVTHTLRLWTARRVRMEGGRATRRVVASGKTASEFWRFVDRYSDPHRTTWLFAHNIGFDLTLLEFLLELDKGTFTLDPLYKRDKHDRQTQEPSWTGRFIVDGPVTIIKVRTAEKRYVCVDTGNYWPSALWTIGERFGLPKLPMPKPSDSDAEWLRYCHRDTEIIERAVTDLITQWTAEGCGVFQTTAASLAFTNWRHTCDVRAGDGDCLDVVCEPDSPKHEMERAAYYGGRFQPFKIGEVPGPVYHVDVNSLYPFIMRNQSFPRRYIRDGYRVDPSVLATEAHVYGVVAEVFIRSRFDTYPVRIDGRQYHCCGQFWTTLAGAELRRALDAQHVSRTGRVQYYSVAHLFKRWVDYWHGRKQKAEQRGRNYQGEREFAKTILNSLSGKFAQRGRRWEDVPGYYALERWGGWPQQLGDSSCPIRRVYAGSEDSDTGLSGSVPTWVNCRGIAGHTQVLLADREPSHAFPAISAFITAGAREYMHTVIAMMPERSVYYLAVDGMIVSQEGLDSLLSAGLIHQTELGYFKYSGPYARCVIHGSNDYELDGKATAAGWKAKAKKKEGVGKVLPVWERLPSVITSGPKSSIQVSEMLVSDYRSDRKGIIGKDDWWTPYRLSLDPEFTDRPPKGGYMSEQLDRICATSWR